MSGTKGSFRAAAAVAALLGCWIVAPPLGAQETEPEAAPPAPVQSEPVTVTATRLEVPAREVASSVTVITAEELQRRHVRTVAQALRTVPGLSVVQTAGRAGVASVFLRGAQSDQTLVLLDGIVLNDPTSPGRGFDFSTLDVSNIERIEVLRGPQSTLYGSDAMGGVVQIITKKGQGPPRVALSAEAGSFQTLNTSAALSGASGPFDYSVAASRESSAGISAADAQHGNDERDGYRNNTFSGRFGWSPGERGGMDLILRAVDNDSELDADYGSGIEDDPNYTSTSMERMARLQGTLNLLDARWKQTLGASLSTIRRDSKNRRDPAHPDDAYTSTFEGEIRQADWQHDLVVHETNTVTVGLATLEETARSHSLSQSGFGNFASEIPEKSATTSSVYVQDQARIAGAFFGTVGARRDDHSRFGQADTYRVTAAFLIGATGTKLKGTYGTGFKAPTLYQLYSEFGNRDLDPEHSIGWDAGFEQTVAGGLLEFGLVYFENRFKDLIDFDFSTNAYANVGEARTRGYEGQASLRPAGPWTLDLTYTQMKTEDLETGEQLLRQPRQKASAEAGWQPADAWRFGGSLLYVGKREDQDFSTFPAERVTLHPYTLLGLSADYLWSPALTLFARGENLSDASYEEVRGYGVPGRAGYAGARVTF